MVSKINQAFELYQGMGMTKQGAAMLIANFITESDLDESNCAGDGGTACGLGQWRFGRQAGMPSGYVEQLKWAVDVEMARDYGGHVLKSLLFDPDAGIQEIYSELHNWERWGVAGNRFQVGSALFEAIK